MSDKQRDSFVFYRSFYEAIGELPDDSRLNIYDAIANYSLNFEDPDFSGIDLAIWKLIKPQLDANNKRYINGCKPKNKQTGSKRQAKNKQKRSKSKANDNDNDNVNDNDNDNKKQYFDCILLTDKEHQKLVEKYGQNLDHYLERLNNYKMSNGKKYKSDYHVMVGWVYERFQEDSSSGSTNSQQLRDEML